MLYGIVIRPKEPPELLIEHTAELYIRDLLPYSAQLRKAFVGKIPAALFAGYSGVPLFHSLIHLHQLIIHRDIVHSSALVDDLIIYPITLLL